MTARGFLRIQLLLFSVKRIQLAKYSQKDTSMLKMRQLRTFAAGGLTAVGLDCVVAIRSDEQ
jgi:hypothetical protein